MYPGPAAQPMGRPLLLSCLQRSLTRLAPGASGPDVERRLAACALSAQSWCELGASHRAPCNSPRCGSDFRRSCWGTVHTQSVAYGQLDVDAPRDRNAPE
jgi:hypothetical protein